MEKELAKPVAFSFTGATIAQLSTLVDEPETGVEKALRLAVPLVLQELADQVGHGLTPDTLLGLVREAEADDVLGALAASGPRAWAAPNHARLPHLLGERYPRTVSRLAASAGIRPTAGDTLLQVSTTAVLGVLGHIAAEYGFSATDFVYWLHAQHTAIGAAMLPRPGAAAGPERTPARQASAPTDAAGASAPVGALRWQWGALLLLAVCLGYFIGHGRFGADAPPAQPSPVAETSPVRAGAALPGALPDAATPPAPAPLAVETPVAPAPLAAEAPVAEATVAEVPVAASALAPVARVGTAPEAPQPARPRAVARPVPALAAAPTIAPVAAARLRRERAAGGGREAGGRYDQDRDTYIYDTGKPIVLTLGDGTTQKVGANSTENRLFTFLASPQVQVDSVNRTKGWINFDRINFETGKALLTPESALQLGNVASILSTFPRAVVKLGGYTDSTGDALVNYQLSEARARAAMLTLLSMGVSPDRVQAKGYGPRYFVRPNNTPAGRALNRRVSIRVLSK